MPRRPPRSTLFPYTTLFPILLASGIGVFAPNIRGSAGFGKAFMQLDNHAGRFDANRDIKAAADFLVRSEEHTSELQSRLHLVCRLLLEKKKTTNRQHDNFRPH